MLDVSRPDDRAWVHEAIRRLEADAERSADTHLYVFPVPLDWGVDLYLKDESAHPTGSLKHRLARSLVLYGLCNGWITEGRTLVEASSGSTAVSEAYFARLLGLPFVAVMPRATSPEKVELIERQGGRCHLVEDPGQVYAEAERVAADSGGHYLDQFTHAERATDWRGNNNIAESVFTQLRGERHPVPAWVVVGAGTGGTSATLGRYVRFRRLATRVACVDPEGSAFLEAWRTGDRGVTAGGSRIEGIGRPRVEPSFLPEVVDRMLRVPDAACVAGMRVLRRHTGHAAGGSTGANLVASLRLLTELREAGAGGSVVTLVCDRADRYEHSLGSPEWLAARGIDAAPWEAALEEVLAGGRWVEPPP